MEEKKVRLQFDIPESRLKTLKLMMSAYGISTQRELLNYGLTMLEWALEERQQGHIIASVNREKKEFYELRMPILNNVRRKLKCVDNSIG